MTKTPAPIEQLAFGQLRLGFEFRPPVAERLQRNPLGLAILPLIQLATTPRLVVRAPESLTIPFA
jgi:hypothetical protein